MELKKKGRYLELPVSGLCIKQIIYNGLNKRDSLYIHGGVGSTVH